MTIAAFIQTYWPFAQASQKYGVPPLFSLAQSAIETGWGKSTPGNMMFGIKANSTYKGKKQLITTTEIHNNKNVKYPEIIKIEPYGNKYKYTVKDYFRAYNSPAESFEDHARFLRSNKIYSNAFKYSNNPVMFAYEVAKSGYATAPNYYEVLKSTISKIQNSGLVKTLVISGTMSAVILGLVFAFMINTKKTK